MKISIKTMKHIILMVALVLTATTWSACSNEDELTTIEQPAQSKTFTVTTTLSPRTNGMRSTMTDNGDGSISTEWKVGDQIRVFYRNTSDNMVTTTAEVTAVNPSTKAATITVTLTDPMNSGEIQFGYPISYYEYSKNLFSDQIGTLADISANFAAIYGVVNMTVSGSVVTLPSVTMYPETCIWKFSFTDGANDITSDITKLVIDFSDSDDHETYIVTPSSQSTIYVALLKSNNKSISITAQTSTGVYRKTAANITLASGKTYTSTGLALTSAAASNVVAGDVGSVIGADGNIYPRASVATACGTTGEAAIVYVGTVDKYFNHFLACALEDAANKVTWSDAQTAIRTYAGNHPITIGGTTYNNTNACTSGYDVVSDNNATTSATATTLHQGWRMPTVTDWRYLYAGIFGKSPTTPIGVNDGLDYYNTHSSGADRSDIQNLVSDNILKGYGSTYNTWFSSEVTGNDSNAWCFEPNYTRFGYQEKTVNLNVVAVFAY